MCGPRQRGRLTRRARNEVTGQAEQIATSVKPRVDQHKKFGGIVGLLRAAVSKEESTDGDWSMTEEERGKVREWLIGVAGQWCKAH